MASIVTIGDLRAIEFMHPLIRKRRRVRLGQVTRHDARDAKGRIERLVSALSLGQPADLQTSEWLAGLGDDIHERIANAGLCAPRVPVDAAPTLTVFFDKLLGQRAAELKPGSVRRLKQTAALLLATFGAGRPLDEITIEAAADWRAGLLAAGKAEATARLHCRNAKSLFAEAVRRELIKRNPFTGLKSAAVAANRERYVTLEETVKILAACPSLPWRVLVGLARYAGLRLPSESDGLLWDNVDWERKRLTVFAPKTGKTRSVPIVPELYALLSEAFLSPEGADRIVDLPPNNRHRTMQAILKRAGLEQWPDLFQALRRSCETWLALTFPQHAVSAWIGHSPRVSREFYLQVPESLFDDATSGPVGSAAKSAAVGDGIGLQGSAQTQEAVELAAAGNAQIQPKTSVSRRKLLAPRKEPSS